MATIREPRSAPSFKAVNVINGSSPITEFATPGSGRKKNSNLPLFTGNCRNAPGGRADHSVADSILDFSPSDNRGYRFAAANVTQQTPLRRAIAGEMGERITPSFIVYYFQLRIWASGKRSSTSGSQNPNWFPNVFNVGELRTLRKVALLGKATAPKGPSTKGGTASASQSHVVNHHLNKRLANKNHSLVKKMNEGEISQTILSMQERGRVPSYEKVAKKDANLGMEKGPASPDASLSNTILTPPEKNTTSSGSGAKRHMNEGPGSAVCNQAPSCLPIHS
eukprot:jgi/Psemu1/53020/gm1.53020_g